MPRYSRHILHLQSLHPIPSPSPPPPYFFCLGAFSFFSALAAAAGTASTGSGPSNASFLAATLCARRSRAALFLARWASDCSLVLMVGG